MSEKHTPGPWDIDWNVSRLDIFSSDGFIHVATLKRSMLSPGIDGAAIANARLIAAAPALLDAAKKVNALSIQTDAHKELRDAFAKATGGKA